MAHNTITLTNHKNKWLCPGISWVSIFLVLKGYVSDEMQKCFAVSFLKTSCVYSHGNINLNVIARMNLNSFKNDHFHLE